MASPSQPQNERSEMQDCVEILRNINSTLKSSMYYTLASHSQSNIAAAAVSQQSRLVILNDRVAYILRNLHQFPQVDQVVNNPMTFQQVEECILPILTQWSRSVTFTTYINGHQTPAFFNSRPLPSWTSFYRCGWDEKRFGYTKKGIDLPSMYDTRLSRHDRKVLLRDSIIILGKNIEFKNPMEGYLGMCCMLLQLHQLDPLSSTLKYGLDSPVVVDYTDKSAYATHVVDRNQEFTERVQATSMDIQTEEEQKMVIGQIGQASK